MTKRILAILLTLAMVLSICSVNVFALSAADGVKTVKPVPKYGDTDNTNWKAAAGGAFGWAMLPASINSGSLVIITEFSVSEGVQPRMYAANGAYLSGACENLLENEKIEAFANGDGSYSVVYEFKITGDVDRIGIKNGWGGKEGTITFDSFEVFYGTKAEYEASLADEEETIESVVVFESASGATSATGPAFDGCQDPWGFFNVIGQTWGKPSIGSMTVEELAPLFDVEGVTLKITYGGTPSSWMNEGRPVVVINGDFDHSVPTIVKSEGGKNEASIALSTLLNVSGVSVADIKELSIQISTGDFKLYSVVFDVPVKKDPTEKKAGRTFGYAIQLTNHMHGFLVGGKMIPMSHNTKGAICPQCGQRLDSDWVYTRPSGKTNLD